jgi:hypothetical protein
LLCLYKEFDYDIDNLVGEDVVIVATVSVSDNDKTFGFFSRPKAILDTVSL